MKYSKSTAIAPANIAFIKYWGKKDEVIRLPLNASISMNLSNCLTTTTVEFSKSNKTDTFALLDGKNIVNDNKETEKVIKHLDRIRKIAKLDLSAKVVSKNNFPKGAGIASSASGFAALTVAASSAAGLSLSEKELSILARIGSGSACRSIPDGFVEWRAGEKSEDSFAYSLYPNTHWDLRDLILLVQNTGKKIGSTKGMENAFSSPFMEPRLQGINNKITKVAAALQRKNIQQFGNLIEEETVNMHAVMMTQNPPLFYWSGETIEIIKEVVMWRAEGLDVYFTIDAGPNVHLFFEAKDEEEVLRKIKSFNRELKYILNKPGEGVKLTDKHLF